MPPQARNPQWGAEVVSATLYVRLRLGLLRRALYSLRPGPLLLLALACAGAALLLGGCTAALLFSGLLLWAHSGGGAAETGEADEASSSISAQAEQLSSASGVSEASSSLLRELDGEAGAAPPSPLPAAAAAAAKVERWYDSLPSGSGAGTARKPGDGAAPTGPADSAMGSSGAGERGTAAALRRRVGGVRLAGT